MTAQLCLRRDVFLAIESASPGCTLKIGDEAVRPLLFDDMSVFPVPGWAWTIVPEGAALELVFKENGQTERIPVTREALLSHLDSLAQLPDPTVYTQISALEHAHYSGISAQLSQDALSFLTKTAHAHGLTELIPNSSVSVGAYDRTDPTARVLAEFGRVVRATGIETLVPALHAQLEDADLTPDLRKQLALDLIGVFSRTNQVDALDKALLQSFKPRELEPDPKRPWQISGALPFLMLRRNFQAVRRGMETLAETPDTWINTEALAWVLRRLTKPHTGFMPNDLFEACWRAGLSILLHRVQAHGHTGGCVALRAAALNLLIYRHLVAQPIADETERVVLRCYGLSPEFWSEFQQVDPSTWPLSFTAAYRAFTMARHSKEDSVLRAGLRTLTKLGVIAAPKAQLSLLGPLGTGQSFPPSLSDTAAIAQPVADTLLRGLAAPLAPPVEGLTQGEIGKLLRNAYQGCPRDPHSSLIQNTVRAAQALLQKAAKHPASAHSDAVSDVVPGLCRLAGQGTDFLGITLTLALARDLLANQATAAAQTLLSTMKATLSQVAQNAGQAMSQNPALMQALQHVRSEHGSGPDKDILDQTISLLPNVDLTTTPKLPFFPQLETHFSALFDTLVVVYSCQEHLDTRIPALRRGWLSHLQDWGIPYVVLTGGPETVLRGDVLSVAAPDTYEGLPQKTLALFEWVATKTGFGHVLKIDDDCILDVPAFFSDQAWRNRPYYGRKLIKSGAQINRSWHQDRSETRSAALSFEKLPDEAVYADGGTGYMLSRLAMTALLEQAATPEGQRLCHAAYSEDKLVGALLGLAGLKPQEEGFTTSVLRNTPSGRMAVPKWASGPGPNASGVPKVTHLDSAGDMGKAHARLADTGIHPPRLWPMNKPPRFGFNSNAMHFLGANSTLTRAIEAEIAVISVVRNEAKMLPYFLRHYRNLGVGGFFVVDNGSEDETLDYLQAQPDVAVFSADTEFRAADQGTDWKVALMAHYRVGKWSVVADADELLLFPGYQERALPVWLRQFRRSEVDAIGVRMLDMYPKGPLSETDIAGADLFDLAGYVDREPFLATSLSKGPYSNTDMITSAVRHRLMPGARPDLFVAQKVAVINYAPWMQFSTSLHFASDVQLAAEPVLFAHFKYHAEFAAKAQREIKRGQYFNNAEEYRRYVALVAEGRHRIYDAAVSVPWQSCQAVRDLLAVA